MAQQKRNPDDAPREFAPSGKSKALLVVVLSVLSLWLIVLCGRLFYIQIMSHDRLVARGETMWAGEDVVPSKRGDIRTSDQVIVARSVQSYVIGVDPGRLDRETSVVKIVKLAADHLGLPVEERRERLKKAIEAGRKGKRFSRIARKVETSQKESLVAALKRDLSRKELSALIVMPSSHRIYPREALLGNVLGVTDLDGKGLEGLELSLDAWLSHIDGRRSVIKDARQVLRIYYPENSDVAPKNGETVVLTIDSRAQRILEEEMLDGMKRYKTACGSGIIMDCRNGDILAMASVPGYSPSEYRNYPEEERANRRSNRVIEKEYEPGSVIKPFIAAWALFTGVASRSETIWKGGDTYRMDGKRRLTDVRDHGPLKFDSVVFKSSNIGMGILGRRLGRDRIIDALDAFGLGKPTGVMLPGEAPGFRQDLNKWTELYTTVSVSFGYEIRVTPIQIATAFSSLINGGVRYRPRLVKETIRDGKSYEIPTEVVARPISSELSAQMREILLKVVEENGTGHWLKMDGFRFGAKSGTADIGKGYSKKDYLASFEAFAPYEDPEIVVLVMMEKPRSRLYYGSWVSGPIVARVLRRYFNVEDQPRLVKRGLDEELE